MRGSKRVLGAAGATLFAMTAMFAAVAIAVTPQTRESYVEQVEPICKKNTQTLERVLKGVQGKIKKDQLKAASSQFTAGANAFEKAVKDLRAVEQPSADTAKLTKWLKQLETGTELLRKISKALKEGKKTQAQTYLVKLSNNSNVANNLVLSFEFQHCRIDSSKFT